MKCMKKIDFPVWFMIFPESKRFNLKTKQILALNRKFSIEHQLPEFNHVLIPKIDVTHAALCNFIDRLDVFYDFTIVYKDSSSVSDYLIKVYCLILFMSLELDSFCQILIFEILLAIKLYLKNRLRLLQNYLRIRILKSIYL